MWRFVPDAPVAIVLALGMNSCQSSPQAGPHQSISRDVEKLYMACSAAPPHSLAQQELVRRLAQKAANGKEVLLVMRASVGVFSSSPEEQRREHDVRALVAAKMNKVATLEQLTDYAIRYPVNPEDARPLVQRMFRLADKNVDAQAWYRITFAAHVVKVDDLAGQAKTQGDDLARH